ncbi:uncharacterized protein BDR25DRAFT_303248 [Lindgomyces ingoldianus]|uniref:Uncharacterized protein n=1 Tax=Lindgomyces ingoldianus TaxID=673940 RepID=A0ACB6QXU6_9PLEO|nr:uncharacterized protein BDR25DRAFT_303248 [Lindgomyces ingoldianus]KAF2471864.1 hypothetical protein BDR25DRAFT_303248 [Lindgomyces ingoldianus]
MTSLVSRIGLIALSVRTVLAQTCVSYGMDFQNGGSYFQNSLSNDNFTFVSQFGGCQADTAYNILVDPTGEQTECSETNLTPDDTNMLSTCPIEKSQLSSGDWSVVIISNNGDSGNPIAYERDFSLSVGPQSTSTYTPTVTATVVTTPLVNVTTTATDTTTSTLPPSTVTSPKTTVMPTVTITPSRVTSTSTKTLLTLKLTKYTLEVVPVTMTKTASCKTPTRQSRHDPSATITPTVGPMAVKLSAKYRRGHYDGEKAKFVKERRARLQGRAPDPQPLVITDANTADWTTVTSTSTAAATTATILITTTLTQTVTPAPITVLSGTTVAPPVTVTAPTPTRTVTRYIIATSITTKAFKYTYTITSTTTPTAVATACKKAGGILY